MAKQLSDTPTANYQRGYAAGMKKLGAMRDAWRLAFERIRQRAARAEAAQGLGPCSNCVFWQREERCEWGYCDIGRAFAEHPHWPAPWAHVERKGAANKPEYRMVTGATFGCVNFAVKT